MTKVKAKTEDNYKSQMGKVVFLFLIVGILSLLGIVLSTYLLYLALGWFLSGIWLIGLIILEIIFMTIFLSYLNQEYELDFFSSY